MEFPDISDITNKFNRVEICQKLSPSEYYKDTLRGQVSAYPLLIERAAVAYRYSVCIWLVKGDNFRRVLTSTNDLEV